MGWIEKTGKRIFDEVSPVIQEYQESTDSDSNSRCCAAITERIVDIIREEYGFVIKSNKNSCIRGGNLKTEKGK